MTPSTTSDAGIQDAARRLAEGRPAEAVAVLERIVADVPAYVTAHVLLAKAYEAQGLMLDALDAWHRAYFLMPGSPLIVRERTRLLRTAPAPTPGPAEPQEQAELREGSKTNEQAPEPEAPSAGSIPAPVEETERDESEPINEMETTDTTAEPAPAPEADEDLDEEIADSDHALGDDDRGRLDAAESSSEGSSSEAGSRDAVLGEVDDLDTLIHQLENAPRIRPDASFKAEGLDEDDDDDEGLVSETLARIYVAQKQYAAAARAYEQLADLHPDRADEFEAEAAAMRRQSEGGG